MLGPCTAFLVVAEIFLDWLNLLQGPYTAFEFQDSECGVGEGQCVWDGDVWWRADERFPSDPTFGASLSFGNWTDRQLRQKMMVSPAHLAVTIHQACESRVEGTAAIGHCKSDIFAAAIEQDGLLDNAWL